MCGIAGFWDLPGSLNRDEMTRRVESCSPSALQGRPVRNAAR